MFNDPRVSRWTQLAGSVLKTVGTSAMEAIDRKVKQASMPEASQKDLELALSAARLSGLAYSTSAAELERELSKLNMKLIHFCEQAPRQPQHEAVARSHREREAEASLPQWYLARDHPSRLFLVFRGTASDDDVIRDLMATPHEQAGLREWLVAHATGLEPATLSATDAQRHRRSASPTLKRHRR